MLIVIYCEYCRLQSSDFVILLFAGLLVEPRSGCETIVTRQSEMADLARRATRWVGTLSHGNVHVKFHDDRLRNGGDITY